FHDPIIPCCQHLSRHSPILSAPFSMQRSKPMARILGYIATSLDGFIATPDENLDWLTQQPDLNLGEHDYTQFIKRISTVVMGRSTYDWVERGPYPWEYGVK